MWMSGLGMLPANASDYFGKKPKNLVENKQKQKSKAKQKRRNKKKNL